MIYTLRRGVNGIRVPIRYETASGLRRFLPAVPLAVAMPQSQTMKRYATYSAIPLLSLTTLLVLLLNSHSILRVGPSAPSQTNSGGTRAASSNAITQPGNDSSASGGSGDNLQPASGGVAGGSSPIGFSGGGVTPTAPAPTPSPAPVGGRGGVSTSVIGIGAVCDSSSCTVTGCTQPVVISQGQKVILGADGTCVVAN